MKLANGVIASTILAAALLLPGELRAGQAAASPPEPQTLISAGPAGKAARGWSLRPVLSADGHTVAFSSDSPDLVPGDANATWDVFVRSPAAGITRRVSIGPDGAEADGPSGNWSSPAISADGRFIAFASLASNLVLGDANGAADVFLHDLHSGQTVLVSRAPTGSAGDNWSDWPSISPDGRYVAFTSLADDLVPGDRNAARDIFRFDRETRSVELVSVNSAGGQAARGTGWASAISSAGRFVAFASASPGLVPGDDNGAWDIFLRDTRSQQSILISQSSDQVPGNADSGAGGGLSISADGSVVAFQSKASNLVQGDTNRKMDIYTRDWRAGDTRRSSVDPQGKEGNQDCLWPALSPDGRFVTFTCLSGMAKYDDNGAWDVFLRDRFNHVTSLVSVGAGIQRGNYNSGFWGPSPVTDGGGMVAFASAATNLTPGGANTGWDIYLADTRRLRADQILVEARKNINMPYCTVPQSSTRGCAERGGCGAAFHGYLCGVCTDVILDAYGQGAGYDLQAGQWEDAHNHPEHRYPEGGIRSAHDMWLYFGYTGQALPPGEPVLPGDAVFFDWDSDGLVEHVALVTRVSAEGKPIRLLDASGNVASNPGGLAQEIPWQFFHAQDLVGYARPGGIRGTIPVVGE